ncbi:MAG: hypothetical protein WB757_08910 [Candidatus Cybelea sp.]
MGHKAGLVFASFAGAALVICACGRQVTPNPPGLGAGGAPPGYLSVFFTTMQPFNFSQYQYYLVFNTSGNGLTPSTDTIQTNWAGYSYALIASSSFGGTFAEPVQFRRSPSNPHIPPAWLPLGTTPQIFSYNLNANGTGTEFQILTAKRVLSSPMPSPSPTSNVWTFNAFVAQASSLGQWTFQDSMGAGGITDPQFVSPKLCMTEAFDNTYYPQGNFMPPDPASQIVSIELANNPVSPSPCP